MMEKVLTEIEQFKQSHPDIAKAMEVFQMSMEEYELAYRFLHQPKIYTSSTTSPVDTDTE